MQLCINPSHEILEAFDEFEDRKFRTKKKQTILFEMLKLFHKNVYNRCICKQTKNNLTHFVQYGLHKLMLYLQIIFLNV